MSARSVLSALDPDKYEVIEIGIDHTGAWWTGDDLLESLSAGDFHNLKRAAILPDPTAQGLYEVHEAEAGEYLVLRTALDVILPVLHGTFGEDGTLQGFLELSDFAYVGAGVLGSALGMDKAVFKDLMRSAGVPVLDSILLLRSEIKQDMDAALNKVERSLAYPVFTKPVNLGSSVGITKCQTRGDLLEGLVEAALYDRRVLVEQGINAREIEVSVLGNDRPDVSIPGEVIPSREYYSYEAKYLDGTSQLMIPADLTVKQSELVRSLALRAYLAIDCAGMARVDFLLDRDRDDLYVSEVNTIPGFTQISMYPKLWEASGLPYSQLLDRLIVLALERKSERDHTERRFRRQN